MSHECACGERFSLRVELAMHRRDAHPVVEDVLEASVPQEDAPRRKRSLRPVVAAVVLVSLLGFNLLMQKTVQACFLYQSSVTAQVVCP